MDNHWSSTKFCSSQFRGLHVVNTKSDQNAIKAAIAKAKGYDDLEAVVGPWTGEAEFEAIARALEERDGRTPKMEESEKTDEGKGKEKEKEEKEKEKEKEKEDVPVRPASPSATVASESAESEPTTTTGSQVSAQDFLADLRTPVKSRSPDLTLLRAPLVPSNELRMPVPALVSGKDLPTPTPSQAAESPESV